MCRSEQKAQIKQQIGLSFLWDFSSYIYEQE